LSNSGREQSKKALLGQLGAGSGRHSDVALFCGFEDPGTQRYDNAPLDAALSFGRGGLQGRKSYFVQEELCC
jgi:hypothetical protein